MESLARLNFLLYVEKKIQKIIRFKTAFSFMINNNWYIGWYFYILEENIVFLLHKISFTAVITSLFHSCRL